MDETLKKIFKKLEEMDAVEFQKRIEIARNSTVAKIMEHVLSQDD